MQKGDSAKLKLLLAGISARLTKNRDFFVQADCTLVSGKKKFDAKLSRADEDYTLHFQGSDRRVDAAEFCAFFAEQAEKYDESVLTYTERSTVVTLSVTARGVQMKQAEREATAEEKAAAANPLFAARYPEEPAHPRNAHRQGEPPRESRVRRRAPHARHDLGA